MEMLTHFYNKNVKLNPQTIINSLDYSAKKSLLKKQLIDVKLMSRFFLKNSAFCSLNIDEEMAHILISDSSLLNLLESIPFLWL
ncbi:putative eAL domain-containing protein [Escherichia coli P0299483.1]|nr:putative eAL domain-containing protein [Escherichia coli P0299483.1]